MWRLLVEKLIEETDVGERPSGHNGVVTSPRAVRVVVSGVQTAKRVAAENVDVSHHQVSFSSRDEAM